jgi:hypothetical protein
MNERKQAKEDKVKINLLIQRSGKYFSDSDIREIKTFLDCKGNFMEVAETLNIDLSKF